MARIRSIHPGLWTDEEFVQLSLAARLLLLGLGTEADDKGVFRWKPSTLKMRVFPADNCDVEDLLGELAKLDLVRSYEIEGSLYGAIRNFRKHQRPKKPNDIHLMPPELRTYVGLEGPSSPSVPPQCTTGSEIDKQMEDGGEDVEEKKELPNGSSKKGTRLTKDWEAPPHWVNMAVSLGLPKAKALTELDRFKDYWIAQPGQRGVKLDWEATWRNWVRRALENVPEADRGKGTDDLEALIGAYPDG